ncbi:MAG: hypothetical protein WA849_16025 [Candidatus Udaeobacter sp.]
MQFAAGVLLPLAAFSLWPSHHVEVARCPLHAEAHYLRLTVRNTEML